MCVCINIYVYINLHVVRISKCVSNLHSANTQSKIWKKGNEFLNLNKNDFLLTLPVGQIFCFHRELMKNLSGKNDIQSVDVKLLYGDTPSLWDISSNPNNKLRIKIDGK